MLIKDSFMINAPQEKVWDFLFDIPRLSECIPGIESVEVVDEKAYRGKLVVKVGPIKSAFTGVVTLTEVNAPDRIAGNVEGDDKSSASSVKASFTGTLKAMDGGTEAAIVRGESRERLDRPRRLVLHGPRGPDRRVGGIVRVGEGRAAHPRASAPPP